MKSRTRNCRAKRGRWDHVNTPDGLRRRAAAADAERERIAAFLPPIPDPPAPLSVWKTIVIYGSDGEEEHRITLYVPGRGHRCDQQVADVDGVHQLMSATAAGKCVAGMLGKRASKMLEADVRREAWLNAKAELAQAKRGARRSLDALA